jgi:hypothetical protein
VNVDKTGALLRPGPAGPVVGYGVDVANNTLYVNDSFDGFTPYNLTTLAPGTHVPISLGVYEDFTFNGSKIVASDFLGTTVNGAGSF